MIHYEIRFIPHTYKQSSGSLQGRVISTLWFNEPKEKHARSAFSDLPEIIFLSRNECKQNIYRIEEPTLAREAILHL